MPETIIYVSNSTELLAALGTATGGETIYLRSGDYGAINLSNLHFSSMVTLASEVPLGAKFTDILIKSSDNLRFDGIELENILSSTEPEWTIAFKIDNSTNIEILNSDIHGSMDGNYNNDGYLINITASSNIILSNNSIHEATRGVLTYQTDNMQVLDNDIYNIRSDGLDFIGVVGLDIRGNDFTNFHPAAGDHADAIQFWNNNSPRSSGNVTIADNTFLQGVGDAFQSMFISDAKGMDYYNFTITGNLIYNGSSHGISIDSGRDITISNNTVLQAADGAIAPRIMVNNPTGTTLVSGNASALSLADSAFITSINNVEVQNTDSSLPTYYANLFMDAFSGPYAVIEDFIPRPGGLLDSVAFIGAYEYFSNTDTLQAQVMAETYIGSADGLKVTFDGSSSTDIDGNTGVAGVGYLWDFGDGTTGEGITLEHVYAMEGDYTVILTVTRNGVSDSTTHTLTVTDPHVLDIATAADLDPSLLLSSMLPTDDSLVFDGTNYLNLGRPDELFNLDEFYLSFDIKPTDIPVGGARLFWSHSRYTVELNGENLIFTVYTDGVANKVQVNNVAIFDGQFHNIALSFDSTTGTITAFIDNVEAGSLSGVVGSVASVGSWDVSVGGTVWGNYFDGEIKNVNIWTAPAPVESSTVSTTTVIGTTTTTDPIVVADTTTTTTDPVASDTTTTTTITDPIVADTTTTTTTTTNTTKTVTDSTVTYETNMVLSIADSTDAAGYTAVGNAVIGADALIFNGKGYVDLGQDANLFGLDAFTLSFDITAGTAKADNKGVVRLIWNQEHYGIEMDGDDIIFRIQTDTGDTQVLRAVGVGANDGQSHTIVMSYDSSTGIMSGYIDNALVVEASGITGSIANATDGTVTVGGGDRGRNFEGEIDNLTVWSDADHTPDATYASASLTVVDTTATDTSATTIIDSSVSSLTLDTTLTTDVGVYNPDDFHTLSPTDTSLL